jgi:hypothetical protein
LRAGVQAAVGCNLRESFECLEIKQKYTVYIYCTFRSFLFLSRKMELLAAVIQLGVNLGSFLLIFFQSVTLGLIL